MNFNTSKLVYFGQWYTLSQCGVSRFSRSLLRPTVIYDLYLQVFLRSCARISLLRMPKLMTPSDKSDISFFKRVKSKVWLPWRMHPGTVREDLL